MNKIRKLPLTVVVVATMFLAVFCLQSIEFIFQYQYAKHKLYVEKEQHIKGIAGNLQTSLSNSLMRLEKAQAQNIVSQAALDHNLKRIAVVDHLHQIVLSNNLRDKYMFAQLQLIQYDSSLLKQIIDKNAFIFQYNEASQDLIVYAPIQMLAKGNSLNRKFNGLIYLRYSLTSALTELRYVHFLTLIKKLMMSLVSCSLLAFIVHRLIIKPLKRITQSMTLATFNDGIKTEQLANGELALLQQALALLSSQVKQRFQLISEREQRLSYALSGARDGVWDWNVEENSIYLSTIWKSMLGYHNGSMADSVEQWEALIHQDDLLAVVKALKQHVSGKDSFFDSTYRLRCHNGSFCWVRSRGQTISWDKDGRPLRIIGTNTEVSHHNCLPDEHAHYDQITQLPNRAQLLDNIQKECARAKHNNLCGAIIFIECNHDKTVEQLQGHEFGEQLLFAIARRIEATKGCTDFVAHIAGSEFGVILPDLAQERQSAADQALAFTKALERVLKTPFIIADEVIQLSSAFGIELFPLKAFSAHELLRHASMALKFSEHNHFSNSFFFSQEIEENIQASQLLHRQISQGLENDDFSLYFQPRVGREGELIGAEALSRWLHSTKGWVNPADFIPVAEDSGLILPLGEWVIKTAFQHLAKWQEIGLPETFTTLSINVSPKQLLEVGFTARIKYYLELTKIDANMIEIEITETALITEPQRIVNKLNKLAQLGFCFAIDDFGTGYSSFSYLTLLPVSTLKIDQSFITNLMHNHTQQVIVTSIISMAKSLNLQVVAEGVESQQQLQFLINQECAQFQGYLVGKPMTEQAFQTLLFKK